MSEELGKLAFETWERLIEELDSDGDAFDWIHMNPVGQQVWTRTAAAVRDAILDDLTAEGRLVDVGYLALLERLAVACSAKLTLFNEVSDALRRVREDTNFDWGEWWREWQARDTKADVERHAALEAVHAHPTWQAAGQRQEGSSDA